MKDWQWFAISILILTLIVGLVVEWAGRFGVFSR